MSGSCTTGLLVLSMLCAVHSTLGSAELPLGHADFMPSTAHPIGYRGDGSGRFPGATPPLQFDYASGKNILWKTKVGPSDCSLIMVKGKVFTCADPGKLLCLDAKTGQILWEKSADPLDVTLKDDPMEADRRRTAFYAATQRYDEARAAKVPKAEIEAIERELQQFSKTSGLACKIGLSMSTGTPASDGDRVYTRFWNGALTAWNLDGSVAWMQIANGGDLFSGMSSPVLVEDKVIVNLGKGSVAAYAVADGKQVWVSGDMNPQMKKAFRHGGHGGSGTMVVVKVGGKNYLVLTGGEVLDASDGRIVSDTEGYCAQLGESPGLFGNQIFFQKGDYHAPNKDPRIVGFTIKADGSFEKNFDLRNLNNRSEKGSTNSTPVFHEGLWYLPCTADGKLQIIDPVKASNEMSIAINLGVPEQGKLWILVRPSAAIAGKHLVMCGEQGKIVFVDPASKKTIGENTVPPYCGDLFFQGDRIYLRSYPDQVVCIGSK